MNKLRTAKTKLGNEIYLTGDEDAKTLIIGVFHGDEPQGKYLIEKYLEKDLADATEKTMGVCPLSLPLPLEGGGHVCQYSKFTLEKSKRLRRNMTDAESVLWDCLRAKRLNGYKFRRQQPIGEYIVDFVCMAYKLVIELDGGQHNEILNKSHDAKRTQYLEKLGYKVLRVWNNEIFSNLNGVLEYILCSLPPRGGGVGRGGKLFIPCLNPDGLQLGQRTNANGVDLNRNFPTKNWELTEKNEFFGGEQPASEIETQFVIDIINAYKPETILTLHAPYKVVNYDGPAQDLAEQISEIINYPVEASIGYPTPGSFGTYAGIERQIKTITLELDETCPVEELEMPVYNIFDTLL